MKISFDPNKRDTTLKDRGIDFADAAIVFDGLTLDFQDNRKDYCETRIITVGHLHDRMMIVVWTPRCDTRHIISMRKTNDRETRNYRQRLEKDGCPCHSAR